MKRLRQDIEIAHRRRWPGRAMTSVSCVWLLLSSPDLRLLLIHRTVHALQQTCQAYPRYRWFWLTLRLMIEPTKWIAQVGAKSLIRNSCDIEGGVCFSSQGHIVYGARKTGSGTVIGPRVTVGMNLTDRGSPTIGRGVWIGADCVIYGSINIGDGATLLPGTVLTRSIPAGVVMQGNPAQLVLRDFDNSELRSHGGIDAMQHVTVKRRD